MEAVSHWCSIISGVLSDVIVVWWLHIVFFQYGKLYMLLKVVTGHTHNVYVENSCSNLVFHYALSPPPYFHLFFPLSVLQVCFQDLVERVNS